jgi:polysaccharide pyruvyl transferase WcaK-like protein
MQNSDLSVLRYLYNRYKNTNRVYLISDEKLNGPQLKYIISKCRFFVGARTHSTIAAYSSCIPTLVLGYSIKSLGIAKDLFGTYDKFVINVNSLQSDTNLLAGGFNWLYNHELEIKNKLKEIMPSYIENSEEVGLLISKLLEK